MRRTLAEPGMGLVTSLIAGDGDEYFGSMLDRMQLNGEIAAGSALSGTDIVNHPIVVGKSMMFRLSEFERLGGFESVAHVLAEDYIMGRMYHAASYGIRVARTPVTQVCSHASARKFFKRHLRWGMIRFRMLPFAYPFEPLAKPLFIAALAPAFGVWSALPVVWAVALTMIRDAVQWLLLTHHHGRGVVHELTVLARVLPLSPLRDVLTFAAWGAAPFRRRVTWRGHPVRVSAGTRLYREFPKNNSHTENKTFDQPSPDQSPSTKPV